MNSKSRPALIGITTYGRKDAFPFSLSSAYIDAVMAAGGVPILLPPTTEVDPALLLEHLDGLILPGGGDIDPARYGEGQHPSIYSVDSERDAFELSLARFALGHHIPVLGICRGLQILIVVSGGTLIPHVPDVYGTLVMHRLNPEPGKRYSIDHTVEINAESRLANIIQNTHISVVSWHHQAVRTVAPGWRATAHSLEDGVIEAVEHEHHPWAIGVQWHPELSPKEPNHQRIFQAFVESTLNKRPSKAAQVRRLLPWMRSPSNQKTLNRFQNGERSRRFLLDEPLYLLNWLSPACEARSCHESDSILM